MNCFKRVRKERLCSDQTDLKKNQTAILEMKKNEDLEERNGMAEEPNRHSRRIMRNAD